MRRTLLAVLLLASLSSAYIYDSDSPFGKCFTKYCNSGYNACSEPLCTPIYSGCAVPCSSIYSNVGCACETMCNFAAEKSDACVSGYISSATGCFPGCAKAEWPGSCASDCEDKAREGYDACMKRTATTRATATTQPSGGCDNNGICEPRDGESCENCENDCPCYDLICSPGTVGATSWGCFDPCLDVDHSHYDPSVDKCVCDDGYVVNDAGNGCVQETGCPERSHLEGSQCYCDDGWGSCDGRDENGCETSLNDVWNCGGCGIKCPADSSCENGRCVCDQGFEVDASGQKCVEFECNNNKQCEPERNEDCYNCPDCGCDINKEYCDPAVLRPAATDERKCMDCERYCELEYDDVHMDAKKQSKDQLCMCTCERGYEMTDDNHCVEAKKKAYVFISSKLGWRHRLFGGVKVGHIMDFYKEKGYEVHIVTVKSGGEILDTLADKPEIKAIAYFGHGSEPDAGQSTATPTIEGMDAKSLRDTMQTKLAYNYNDRGMPLEQAQPKAAGELKDGFGFDYAYIHACYSYDDTSLAEMLVKKGGTFWGDKGILVPAQTLYEHKKQ